MDSRATKEIDWLNQKYGKQKVLEFNGRPLCSNDIPPKMLWLKNNEPDIFHKAYKLLTASSFLTAKLTGKYTIDRFLAFGPFAPLYNKQDGSPDMEYVPEFCREDQLAEVRETVDIAGYVTENAARESGLFAGTPVITGTDDSAAEAISTGVIENGDLMLQLGSSLYMIGICEKMVKDTRIWSGGFLIPGCNCIQGGTNAAGTLTKWYRNELFTDYLEDEKKGEENAFSRMAGVGEVRVYVTLAGSGEETVLKDEGRTAENVQEEDSGAIRSSERTEEEETTVTDSEGNPYVVSATYPKVQGILIVAQGAESAVVREQLMQAASTLLGLSYQEIQVATYQS